MKRLTIFLLLACTLVIASGCNSNETTENVENDIVDQTEVEVESTDVVAEEDETEDLVNHLQNYEIVVLEHNDDYRQIRVEYPKFDYEPLDEILADKEDEFEGQLEQAEVFKSEGIEDVYHYHINVEKVIITENIVSIYYEGRFYHGGGFDIASSLNYDLKNDRVIELEDVLEEHSISLVEMADLVAENLMSDERFLEQYENPELLRDNVEEETKPIDSNYSTFTLTEESITFYKQYYSLFANADGIFDVEVTWDEVKEYKEQNSGKADSETLQDRWIYEFGDAVKASDDLEYVDKEFGFSVKLPESWKGKYFVQLAKSDFEYFPTESSKSIVFNMVDNGKYMGYIFSIEVLEGISEAEVKEYYEDWPGFEGYIGAGNDVVLIYSRPAEMETPLYEEPYIEVGRQLSKMVEEDMPKIIETVEFY